MLEAVDRAAPPMRSVLHDLHETDHFNSEQPPHHPHTYRSSFASSAFHGTSSPFRLPLHLLSPPNHSQQTRTFSHTSIHHLPLTTNNPSSPSPKLSNLPDASPPTHLTHLTPSGTAHMVSISSKNPTTRRARASCTISFTSSLPLRLIRENAMKKGDVLGTARVAGIMAAKRTAELIPLCHPIAITHVVVELTLVEAELKKEVEVEVEEEGGREEGAGERVSVPWSGTGQGDAYAWDAEKPYIPTSGLKSVAPRASPTPYLPSPSPQNQQEKEDFGSIRIEAEVACEGKTGVEMEALTAAGVAALTVYDMCKAVDKGMRIEGLRVVEKVGGKSGGWREGVAVGGGEGKGGD